MVPHCAVRQRGAIGLIAALTLGLALLFMLLVVDSGRLYLEQRKLQRIADMAALEAVSGDGTCVDANPTATALARKAALRNGHAETTDHALLVECGSVESSASGFRAFVPDTHQAQAIRVTVSHRIPSSIAVGAWRLVSDGQGENRTTLQAQATAGRTGPALARLAVRSSLVDIDTTQSERLNTLFGDLLNTELNLSLAQWQGLLRADVNLLHFLDALSVTAGNYTELLHTELKLSEIFTVMAAVAAQDNPRVNVSGLIDLGLATQGAGAIALGDILSIQNGGTTSGLNATLTALQLVQGMIELANSMHAVETTLSSSILGLAHLSTRLQIIEPPQFSAVGDPSLAKESPAEPGQIYVRTAQARILIQANLAPLLGGLNLGIIQLTPNPSVLSRK